MTLLNSPGNKPNWAREVDSDNWQDILGLTAVQAADFTVMSAKAVVDANGNKLVVFDGVRTSSDAIVLTEYNKMAIGSRIIDAGVTTKTAYWKCANNGAVGDWYLEQLTQAT